MTYKRSDFVQFSSDADRTVANLTTAYENWVDAQRDLGLMPSSLYWQAKGSAEYLAIKDRPNSPGTTIGGRSPETEAQLSEHQRTKDALKTRIHQAANS